MSTGGGGPQKRGIGAAVCKIIAQRYNRFVNVQVFFLITLKHNWYKGTVVLYYKGTTMCVRVDDVWNTCSDWGATKLHLFKSWAASKYIGSIIH